MARARDELPGRMTVDEFLRWVDTQPDRYELVDGVPVAMAPGRAVHARLKARMWRELDREIVARQLPCEVLPDGMGLQVDDETLYEPDAVVYCGDRLADDERLVPAPVIVVEVLSPSTQHVDTGGKLAGYFQVPSVRHYLIVESRRPAVIHHTRSDDGQILTRIVTGGTLALDPPGIALEIEDLYR